MAQVNYGAHINLADNQLLNASLQHVTSDPTGVEGKIIYRSDNGAKVVKFYNGTSWLTLSSGAGDITAVVAGAGMTGGATSGDATLNVIGGTGITANADNIAITAGGVGTTQLANDGVTADKIANSINSAIAANTAKNTNVSTDLSLASGTGSRVLSSSDGDNATFPVATTSVSGLMSTTIFDAVAANSAKNTNVVQTSVSGASGTVTSIGNLTGDVTSSNRATTIGSGKVTMAKLANIATDTFIGRTASGSGVPKALSKSEALAILNVADGANVNVATNLGITGDAAARVITSSTGTNVTIPVATTSVSGLLTPGLFDEIDANTAKVTNTDVDVNNANLLTRLAALESAGGAANQNIVIGTDAGDTIVVTGNLQVDGATTTVSSETVSTTDNNIVLAKDNNTGAVLNATGLTFEGGSGDDVTLQWLASANALELKKGSAYTSFKAGTITAAFTGALTGNASGSAGTVTTIGNLTGDVTSSNRATTIAADAVTYAKMQNLATGNRVLGATSAGVIGEVQVVEAMIADDAVTADKLANAINTAIAANTSKATNVSTNLSATTATTQITLNSSDGSNVVVAQASGSIAGVMTVAHHDKLDGIETSATADQSKSDIEGLAIQTTGAVTSGSWTATDIAVAHGGTGSSNASGARTNLGVAYANDAETLAASSSTKVVTPAGLKARSFKAIIGDDSATAFNIDHGLATRDVIVQMYDASSYETVYAQVVRSLATRVVITFNAAPGSEDVIVLITKVD